MIKSIFSALAMYSRIPVPLVEWKEENRRYALAMFWIVGVFIGAFLVLTRYICNLLNVGNSLYAAISVAVPFLITGGIHLDGFCDVIDAEASCQTRERKLEIMSDSHIGAFPAIVLPIYYFVLFGLFTEIKTYEEIIMVSFCFIFSRVLSAFAAMSFKSAKNKGSLYSFSNIAYKSKSIIILSIVFILITACAIFINVIAGVVVSLMAVFSLLCYKRLSYKKYNGISGDMAGFYVQATELFLIFSIVITFKIIEVIL